MYTAKALENEKWENKCREKHEAKLHDDEMTAKGSYHL